jgi:hypothetical protein
VAPRSCFQEVKEDQSAQRQAVLAGISVLSVPFARKPSSPAPSRQPHIALSLLPLRDARSHLVDHARYFVSTDARVRNAGEKASSDDHAAVTHAAGLDANPHVSRAGQRNLALHDFKVRSRLQHLHRFHFRHLRTLLPICVGCIESAVRWHNDSIEVATVSGVV